MRPITFQTKHSVVTIVKFFGSVSQGKATDTNITALKEPVGIVTSILITKKRAGEVGCGLPHHPCIGPHRNSGKPGIESLQWLVPGLLLQAAYSWIASHRHSHCTEH